MAGIEFADVAASLSCETFARRELRMRGNRAQCPFHGGEHFNLAFFPDGKCYCHVCHKCGDVVTLAAATWHTNQRDAARMLNDEYRLGLSDDVSQDDLKRQRERRQRERDQREADERRQREAWSKAADDLREAEAAAERLTIADADKPGTWTIIARYVKALSTWEALRAGVL